MKIDIPAIQAQVLGLLQGEPLRFISYGAIAVVFLVTRAEVALGLLADSPDFLTISAAVLFATTSITELARRFVYSPKTVAQVLNVPVAAVPVVVDAILTDEPVAGADPVPLNPAE